MPIAFDATASSFTASGTTLTYTHVCTGSNLILFVVASTHSTSPVTAVTGITYNSVAMTSLSNFADGNARFNVYYLLNPATGSNDVVITTDTTDNIMGESISYTGAKQSGVPDVSGNQGPTTGTGYGQNLITSADNCWVTMFGGAYSAATLTPFDGNTTIRFQPEANLTGTFILDSNGPKTPAGTISLDVTSSSQKFLSYMLSFAPFTIAVINKLPLLGVG